MNTPEPAEKQTDDMLFSQLAKDLKELEAELLPQLNMLAEKMPEVYKGYATMVRKSVSVVLDLMTPGSKASNALGVAAELGARGIEAYGAWKAAKKHNRMLDKYLKVKKEIAATNLAKVERLLPETEHKLQKSSQPFLKYAKTTFPLSKADRQTVLRTSALTLRWLAMYRTNLFLKELCSYLRAEYTAWQHGKQTSDMPMPDYYTANDMILHKLFSTKPFNAIKQASDSNGDMTGAQLMLLSDAQLAVFALKDNLCDLDIDEASPAVAALIGSNKGLEQYIETTAEVKEHISDAHPHAIVSKCAIAALVVVAGLCLFYIPGHWLVRTIIGVSAAVGIFKIWRRSRLKIMYAHAEYAQKIGEAADSTIEAICGRVKQPEIDYERKDAVAEGISSFFS